MRFEPEIVERLFATYASLGLSREAAGLWCIPWPDARVLIENLDPARHRKILDVGTYVGVATMLMAMHAPDCHVHSVDPNEPLALGTPGRGVEQERAGGMRTQELARAAAQQLGISERVHLHAGGFAVAGDFASRAGRSTARLPRIGPQVCRDHGPFDFVFVDGLHYHDAVLADLELVATALAPGGAIVLHDLIGLWGSNLRWATHRFIERHPEFVLRHEPYREIYQCIGTLMRRSEAPPDFVLAHPVRVGGARFDVDPRMRAVLLAAAWRERPRERVIELLAPGAPSFRAEASAAGAATSTFELSAAIGTSSIERASAAAAEMFATLGAMPASPAELVLCLGTTDVLDDAHAAALLRAVAARGSRVLIGFTPPGERGAAGWFSRTLPQNLALLAAAGLRIELDLSLDVEPHRHPYWTGVGRESSHLLHLFAATSAPVEPGRAGGASDSMLPATTDHGAGALIEAHALSVLFRDLILMLSAGRLSPITEAQLAAADQEQLRTAASRPAGPRGVPEQSVGSSA